MNIDHSFSQRWLDQFPRERRGVIASWVYFACRELWLKREKKAA